MVRFLFFVFLAGGVAHAAPLSLFDPGEHCVAYRAQKRLLLVASVKVVGKSCQIATQVVPELDGQYRIEVTLPLSTLKSGEVERDTDVAMLLGARSKPDLTFLTESRSAADWQKILGQEKSTIQGELRFADKAYPLEATIAVVRAGEGLEIDGVIKTSFRQLQLKPPTMALGLFAQVRDQLELHFHVLSRQTLGAATILPVNP